MEVRNKATNIDLFSLKTPQMRAFHMSWFAFFLCFFAWFGIAPLMAVVREELDLTKEQIGNTIIASVSITIVARLFIGWLVSSGRIPCRWPQPPITKNTPARAAKHAASSSDRLRAEEGGALVSDMQALYALKEHRP